MYLYNKIKAVLREQEVDDSYELIRALEDLINVELEKAYDLGREDGYDAGQCAAESQAAFEARNAE